VLDSADMTVVDERCRVMVLRRDAAVKLREEDEAMRAERVRADMRVSH
jgi:hypothetical protein